MTLLQAHPDKLAERLADRLAERSAVRPATVLRLRQLMNRVRNYFPGVLIVLYNFLAHWVLQARNRGSWRCEGQRASLRHGMVVPATYAGLLVCCVVLSGPALSGDAAWPPPLAAHGDGGPQLFRSFAVADAAARAAVRSVGVAVATRAEVVGDGETAKFVLRLSRGVPVEVYTLANPFRVILDLPDVGFRLPKDAGRKQQGLVTAFRYGLFAEGKGRIVIDTSGPVLISGAEMVNEPKGGGVELIIALRTTDTRTFGAGTGAGRAKQDAQAGANDSEPDPNSGPKTQRPGARPVIIIDPGHGGIDPGTVSPNNVSEKALVLSVALKLERKLKARGRYDVHMTRRTDVFVSLDNRLKFSRDREADLFISLHADAIAETALTQNIRGATVYTLSERASDEQARLMAEKENNSDLVAGLSSEVKEQAEEVNHILIDLMRRETANFSTDFSNVLVSGLRKSVKLSRAPKRSAAFKVLKQTKTPSVLIELGYLSNLQDEKMMLSAEWQHRVTDQIGAAVDSYFAQRSARAQ